MTYRLPEPVGLAEPTQALSLAKDLLSDGKRYSAEQMQAAYAAGLAEERKVTEVWSVSSKVFSVLFATEAQADRFIASTTATMGATKNRLDILQPEPEPKQ